VNSVAREWGIKQQTLDRYVKMERMPDFKTALKIAQEAGVDPGEALATLAKAEQLHRARLQKGSVQIDMLVFILTGGLSCLFYIM
jgi:transcriptional regulator with XRE-family HTH domain